MFMKRLLFVYISSLINLHHAKSVLLLSVLLLQNVNIEQADPDKFVHIF